MVTGRVFLFALGAIGFVVAEAARAAEPEEKGAALEAAVADVVRRTDEIVVEGSAWSGLAPTPIDETRSHDVLTPKRLGDFTVTTYEEVVKRLPGVTSRLYSGDEYVRPSISMRGMPDNGFTEYTAVLVDGINMSTLFYGWTAISIFPFTAERIYAAEVIRGGHSVRYGPNTIGGIVNVSTRPVPQDPFFRQQFVFGSHHYHSSITEFGGRIPGSDLALLGNFVEKGGDTFRENDRFDVNEFALKGVWDLDEATWLAFSAFHWRAVHGLPARLTRAQLDADREQNPNPDWVDWHGFAYGGSFTLHHRFTDENWAQLYGYYRFARRALDSGRPTAGPFTSERSADSDMVNMGLGVEGEVAFEAGVDHVLHYGLRAHRETIHRKTFEVPVADGGASSFTQDATSKNVAIAANLDDTLRFGDLTLVLGLRYEVMPVSEAHDRISDVDRDFDLSILLPGVSASYAFSDRFALFANAHRSFRPPQTWGYDFSMAEQDLDFEEGSNFELGARWMDVEGLSGSVVLWRVDFSEFLDYDPDTDVYTNLGAFRSHGVDLTVEFDPAALGAPEGFALYGTTTWQNSEFDEGPNKGKDTPFVPAWSAEAGLRYEHECGPYGAFSWHYWGSAPVDAGNTVDTASQSTFELRLGYRKSITLGDAVLHFDAAAAVKNLFDKEVNLRATPTMWVPGAPRELFGSLSVSIDF